MLQVVSVGMMKSSEEAARGAVGQKLLVHAAEQLPDSVQMQLASCVQALEDAGGEGSVRGL